MPIVDPRHDKAPIKINNLRILTCLCRDGIAGTNSCDSAVCYRQCLDLRIDVILRVDDTISKNQVRSCWLLFNRLLFATSQKEQAGYDGDYGPCL